MSSILILGAGGEVARGIVGEIISNGNYPLDTIYLWNRLSKGLEEVLEVSKKVNAVRRLTHEFNITRMLPHIDLQYCPPSKFTKIDADVIINAAGDKGEEDRAAAAEANRELLKGTNDKKRRKILGMQLTEKAGLANLVIGHTKVLINLANPSDEMTYELQRLSGIDPKLLVGSSHVDTMRFRYFLRNYFQEQGVKFESVDGYVVGGHNPSMVPLFSSVRVDGEFMEIPSHVREQITSDVKDYNKLVDRQTWRSVAKSMDEVVSAVYDPAKTVCMSTYGSLEEFVGDNPNPHASDGLYRALRGKKFYVAQPIRFIDGKPERQDIMMTEEEVGAFVSSSLAVLNNLK